MDISGDAIADLVLRQFDALPPKRKPLPRHDGSREWVPLAGIVAETRNGLRCIALGTGMKCLPAGKLPSCKGNVIHDSHAEIVAIRCLNRFLLEECLKLAMASKLDSGQVFESELVQFRDNGDISEEHFQSFAIKDDVKFHMYCSEAPCGDASMELIMAQQADPTPWALSVPTTSTEIGGNDTMPASFTPTILPGRANFSLLSIVRRKPSRPDAPPTSSKSCTDKLAHYQCSSFLSSLASLIIHPSNAYLSILVVPESQLVRQAIIRAFEERFHELIDHQWYGGYRLQLFRVKATKREFIFSRRHDKANDDEDSKERPGTDTPVFVPSNVAAVFHAPDISETLIGGVLQGRKHNDPRGASILSRRRMWKLVQNIVTIMCDEDRLVKVDQSVGEVLKETTYERLKNNKILATRRKVKLDTRTSALKGWIRGEGDEDWGLDYG